MSRGCSAYTMETQYIPYHTADLMEQTKPSQQKWVNVCLWTVIAILCSCCPYTAAITVLTVDLNYCYIHVHMVVDTCLNVCNLLHV